MSVELFMKLKEIESLSRMRTSFELQNREHNARLSKLNDTRQEAHARTVKLRQEVSSANSALADIEVRIRTASEQKQRLFDIGSDEKKISSFTTEIDGLEESGLVLLEEVAQLEEELRDTKEFMSGLEKTILEISAEVNSDVAGVTIELSHIELRLSLLLNELPTEFSTLLVKTAAKNLAHGPFTRVENGSCYFCRFKISRTDESEIDMQKNLKTCSQCSRIFLPYGA